MSTPTEPTPRDPFGPDGPEISQTFSEPVAATPAADPAAAPHVPEREPDPAPAQAAPPPAQADPPPAPPAPPQYARPGQGGQYVAPPAAPARPNTWMNIVALVTALLGMGIVPVIFGHLGLSQAKKGRADLRGLGIAGLVLGYLEIVAGIIILAIVITVAVNCSNNPDGSFCSGVQVTYAP